MTMSKANVLSIMRFMEINMNRSLYKINTYINIKDQIINKDKFNKGKSHSLYNKKWLRENRTTYGSEIYEY